jgi:reactive intermediate/imine deaminase
MIFVHRRDRAPDLGVVGAMKYSYRLPAHPRRPIMPIQHHKDPAQPATLPFSAAVAANGFVFVSGQVAKGDDGNIIPGDIEAHTRQTLRNVERALALAGCTLRDVVKVTVWLQDAADFARFNRVYAEFFPGDRPARSTTQAKLVVDSRIEIEAIASKG